MLVMDSMFYPKSIAVIGASPQEGKVGNTIIKNLVGSYRGKVFAVNPKYREILGVPCFPSVSELPEVDLAVVVVPAKAVPDVVEECGRRGIRNVVIISAGFREAGIEGAKLERRIVEAAKTYGINVVGPNCLGIINTEIEMNATFSKVMPDRGRIAFLSQSGAFILAVLDWAKQAGVGFSKVVSLGNKAVLDETDFLEYLERDSETDVVLMYLEGISRGREFMDAVRRISRVKPVVVMKSGRTQSGAKAASSHTGSLAGSYEAYRAAFIQCGAIDVDSVEELFDYSIILSKFRGIRGGLAIITNSGGPGVMAADASETYGIELAGLSGETIEKLKEVLPPESSMYNPIDILGDATSDRFERTLRIVEKDGSVGIILAILTPTAQIDFEKAAHAVITSSKPVVCCFMGGKSIEGASKTLISHGVPNFFDPVRAVRAIAVARKYEEIVEKEEEGVPEIEVDRAKAENIIKKAGQVIGVEGIEVLEAYGIRVAPYGIARTAEEAEEIADSIGYPVVMKVVSPDILHKSDVGGVKLNVTKENVKKAFYEVLKNAESYMRDAKIEGVVVQKMIEGGREVIIGMKRDPQFGPLIMFGLGGVYVEVFRDVTFRVAPLTKRDAYEMIKGVKAYRILRGIRGEKPVDIDSIADALLKISKLSIDFPQILEMDINPLKVFESGCVAVDFRMIVGGDRR